MRSHVNRSGTRLGMTTDRRALYGPLKPVISTRDWCVMGEQCMHAYLGDADPTSGNLTLFVGGLLFNFADLRRACDQAWKRQLVYRSQGRYSQDLSDTKEVLNIGSFRCRGSHHDRGRFHENSSLLGNGFGKRCASRATPRVWGY